MTMEKNNLFSFQRFVGLFRQSLIINRWQIGISIVGFSGLTFLLLIILQSQNMYGWGNRHYANVFMVLFLTAGFFYSGFSFPAFREKERSTAYLLLPASVTEKFLFEFLTRIVLFVILVPLLFWAVANLEGAILHSIRPEIQGYRFSFLEAWQDIAQGNDNAGWIHLLVVQACLLAFTLPFAGASHFSKSPIFKILFTLSIVAAGYVLLIFLSTEILNIQAYTPANDTVLFINNDRDILIAISISLIVINLSMLAIAWFKFKEKEA